MKDSTEQLEEFIVVKYQDDRAYVSVELSGVNPNG